MFDTEQTRAAGINMVDIEQTEHISALTFEIGGVLVTLAVMSCDGCPTPCGDASSSWAVRYLMSSHNGTDSNELPCESRDHASLMAVLAYVSILEEWRGALLSARVTRAVNAIGGDA